MIIKNIPFGEFNLTRSQVSRMAKTLWDNPDDVPSVSWNSLTDKEQEKFIRVFVVTIPKTLSAIGLKVEKK